MSYCLFQSNRYDVLACAVFIFKKARPGSLYLWAMSQPEQLWTRVVKPVFKPQLCHITASVTWGRRSISPR